jgi:hypothetical protein
MGSIRVWITPAVEVGLPGSSVIFLFPWLVTTKMLFFQSELLGNYFWNLWFWSAQSSSTQLLLCYDQRPLRYLWLSKTLCLIRTHRTCWIICITPSHVGPGVMAQAHLSILLLLPPPHHHSLPRICPLAFLPLCLSYFFHNPLELGGAVFRQFIHSCIIFMLAEQWVSWPSFHR